MLSLLTIVLNAITIVITRAELKCPSKEYVFCAVEGTVCEIPDSIKAGYISWGTTDKWQLHVFKHYGNDDNFKINCGVDQFGWIYAGHTPYCCYLPAKSFEMTGFRSDWLWHYTSNGITQAIENGELYTICYHNGVKFLYEVKQKKGGDLVPDQIISPFTNTNQYYYASPEVPTSLETAEWTVCGSQLACELGTPGCYCSGFTSGFLYWIKYGENGYYHYQLVTVVGDDVSIECSNNVFGNALEANWKYCYKSQPIYSFGAIVSGWKKIYSCIGCSSIEKSITVGIRSLKETSLSHDTSQTNDVSQSYEMSNARESSKTQNWQAGVEATVEANAVFVSGSVSASASGGEEYGNTNSYTNTHSRDMTSSEALSVAYGILNTVEESKEETLAIVCKEDVLWQFLTAITQTTGLTSERFAVQTDDWICLPEGKEPKCPPGFCPDALCQDPCATTAGAVHTPPISWINKYHKPKISINTKPIKPYQFWINNDKYVWIIFVLVSIFIITVNILCCKKYVKYKQQNSRKSIPTWIETN